MIIIDKELKSVTKATTIANNSKFKKISDKNAFYAQVGSCGNYTVVITKGKDVERDLIFSLYKCSSIKELEKSNKESLLISVTIKSPTVDDLRNNHLNTQRTINYCKGYGSYDAKAIYTFINLLGLRGVFYQVGIIPEENGKVVVGKLS